jgi:hypothetical protein
MARTHGSANVERRKADGAMMVALAELGTRGEAYGIAYAYSARCGEFHLDSPWHVANTARIEHISNGAYKGRARKIARFTDRTRQPKSIVRSRRVDVSALRNARTLATIRACATIT